jgi:hypothetical protein
MNLLEIAMLFLNQVIGFFQIISDWLWNLCLWNCPLLVDVEKTVCKFTDFNQSIYTATVLKLR